MTIAVLHIVILTFPLLSIYLFSYDSLFYYRVPMKKTLLPLICILLICPESRASVVHECRAKAKVVKILTTDVLGEKVKMIISNNAKINSCAEGFSGGGNSTRKISASWGPNLRWKQNFRLKKLAASNLKVGSTLELNIYPYSANTPNGPISSEVWEIISVIPEKTNLGQPH